MVSFQQLQIPSPAAASASLLSCIQPSPNHLTCSKTVIAHELFDQKTSSSSSNKRKLETKEHEQENFDIAKESNKLLFKKSNTHKTIFFNDIEFELEKPLPLEWQRCLDIQSGKVHFYNTRTQMRTSKDPRQQQEEEKAQKSSPGHSHMSLELELNLPYDQSTETKPKVEDNWTNSKSLYERLSINRQTTKKNSSFFDGFLSNGNDTISTSNDSLSSSWLSNLEVDDHREMVAVVCMRCHMLVMLCKATPSCPNCKFIYPPEQTPISSPNLCNSITKMSPRFTRLLCSKDY